MRPSDYLADLQQIDAELDRISARLDDIRAELADRSAIEAAQAVVDTAASARGRAEADQRDLDLEVSQFRAKLKTVEDKLYGGRISSPKELTDLTHEADQTRRQISQREDRLLEMFDATDTVRREQDRAAAALATLQDERSKREQALAAEINELSARRAVLESEREATRALLAADHIRQYDRLRTSKGGLAVVEIRQRICQGCRVALTTTEEHRARSGDHLITCSSCGRILHAPI
jgi:predicted  nucleic acid-binding Zn-ribbon protein